MTPARPSPPSGSLLAYAPRERVRALLRRTFARRSGRLHVARSAAELNAAVRAELVDAVVVDLGAPSEETWTVAALAPELPTMPFFAIAPAWAAEAPALARCAALGFTDVLAEGVDEQALGALVAPHRFSRRFAEALAEPPESLQLRTPLQRTTWRFVVAHAGRPVTTSAVAQHLAVTREHLSRSFAAGGAPTLKRVIDLVRVVAAAELAKNPAFAIGDVAAVLGFASSSHLATTTRRIVGTPPRSLARLRAVDLFARFASGGGA